MGEPRRRHADRGTTITEILVVLSVTSLLAIPLLGVLQSASTIERDRVSISDARVELDWALARMSEDLRSATPVARLPPGTDATHTLPLLVTAPDASLSLVYWTVTPTALQRVVADPDTGRVLSRATLIDSLHPDGLEPFVYSDATGARLDPAAVGLARLADCTTLIDVTLAVRVHDRTISSSTSAAVRTRPPGGNGC